MELPKKISWRDDIKGFDGMHARLTDPELRENARAKTAREARIKEKQEDYGL